MNRFPKFRANHCQVYAVAAGLFVAFISSSPLLAEVSFKPGAQEILLPFGQGEFQLSQLNGDKHIDILVALEGRITAYLNDGSGVYGEALELLRLEEEFELDAFDIDSDGDTDLWISQSDGNVSIWENRAGALHAKTAPEITAGSLSVGDIDGDGDLDVLIAQNSPIAAPPNFPGVGHQIWLNEGMGEFVAGQLLTTEFPEAGVGQFGDVDGDLHLDFLATYPGEGAMLWLGDGEGGFTESEVWIAEPAGGHFASVALADFDDDSDLDLFLSHSGGQNLWWPNLGGGVFESLSFPLGDFQPLNTIGDLDNDSDVDLVSAGANCQDCATVWFSDQGSLRASDLLIFSDGASIHQLELADVDGDGDLDVIALLDIIEAPAGRTVVSTWLNGLIDLSEEPSGVIGIKDPTLAFVIRQRLDLPPDLAVLPDYSDFTSLQIDRDNFGAAFDPIQSLSGLEAADQLESVEINGVLNLEESGGVLDLRFLANWTHLKTLHLNGNGIQQLILPETWSELRELSLDDNIIFDIGFITQLPVLENLSLSGNQVAVFNPSALPLVLKDLDLSANPLTEIRIPSCVTFLQPPVDALRNAGVTILGDQQIRALFSPSGEARRFEFRAGPGAYLVRRSVNLVDWEPHQELVIEASTALPVVFSDDESGLGSAVFYSIVPQLLGP